MPVANGDILKAVWQARHSSPNTIVQNVFHWRVDDFLDGDDQSNFLDILERLRTTMYPHIALDLSERYVLDDVRVTNDTQKTFVGDGIGAGFAGTGGAGEVLPAQDAVLVYARSRQLGHQKRCYLGPYLEASVENGALTAAAFARAQDFAEDMDDSWLGALTNNQFVPVTVKYNPGGAIAQVTNLSANLHAAERDMRTQRRRRPTVGLS